MDGNDNGTAVAAFDKDLTHLREILTTQQGQLAREMTHLRELLTERHGAMDRVLTERFASIKLALELEAKEIARRLEILNGEAERLRTIQATYLPRELAESRFKELDEKAEQLRKAIEDLNAFRANTLGKQTIYAVATSAVVSVAILLFSQFLRAGKP